MRWSDIEVVRDPAGAPDLRVGGAVAAQLRGQHLRVTSVSLAHTTTQAIATVLLFPE